MAALCHTLRRPGIGNRDLGSLILRLDICPHSQNHYGLFAIAKPVFAFTPNLVTLNLINACGIELEERDVSLIPKALKYLHWTPKIHTSSVSHQVWISFLDNHPSSST